MITLSQEQQDILDGANGQFAAKCMRWLVNWGNAMGATNMIRVDNVMPSNLAAMGHILDGAAKGQIRDYLGFVKECCGSRVKCTTTQHIARFDMEEPDIFGIDQEQLNLQKEIIEVARGAGINLGWSCTPYLQGVVPLPGQICAWTESHAVVFINSFLGARTTRNGGESAIAAAVTGWVPAFGALRDEGRKPQLLIRIMDDVSLDDDLDWGLLGYYAGIKANIRTPAIVGAKPCRIEAAKQMCAGAAASGGVTMIHVVGVTPEAPTLEAVFPEGEPEECYEYGATQVAETLEPFSAQPGHPVDTVYFGCPHATLQEFIEIADLIEGKHVHAGVGFYVTTSYGVKCQAKRMGYVKIIEDFGGRVMADCCPLQANYYEKIHAWNCMATNAVKQAHYARGLLDCKTLLGTTERCVRAALNGYWE